MLLQPDYTTGTVSISDGSAALTGSGTAWLSAGFQPGDLFMKNNRSAVILSINSNTSITLAENWDGGNLAGASYRIRYQPDLSRVSAQARQLIDMLASGNLPALGELNGVGGDKGIHLTGAGTAATHALTAFMRGILGAADGPTAYGGLGQIPNAQVRNDLPADKAFRRGNAVGTVSQSGGVPTGAIAETGSNANGVYIRMVGGLQICWQPSAITVTANNLVVTPIHRTSNADAGVWTFPAPFASGSAILDGATSDNFNSIPYNTGRSATGINFIRILKIDGAGSASIWPWAIGRWHT